MKYLNIPNLGESIKFFQYIGNERIVENNFGTEAFEVEVEYNSEICLLSISKKAFGKLKEFDLNNKIGIYKDMIGKYPQICFTIEEKINNKKSEELNENDFYIEEDDEISKILNENFKRVFELDKRLDKEEIDYENDKEWNWFINKDFTYAL